MLGSVCEDADGRNMLVQIATKSRENTLRDIRFALHLRITNVDERCESDVDNLLEVVQSSRWAKVLTVAIFSEPGYGPLS